MSGLPDPGPTVGMRLAGIVVHLLEYAAPHGVPIDLETAKVQLADADVQAYMQSLDSAALLPACREPVDLTGGDLLVVTGGLTFNKAIIAFLREHAPLEAEVDWCVDSDGGEDGPWEVRLWLGGPPDADFKGRFRVQADGTSELLEGPSS